MAIGPVQLIVIGFSHPEFHGEIIAELQRLHDDDTARMIDALAVHKHADGEIEVQAPRQVPSPAPTRRRTAAWRSSLMSRHGMSSRSRPRDTGRRSAAAAARRAGG